MRIIETNISYYLDGNIADHQSRVINTCNNWNEYVFLFENYDGDAVGQYNSTMNGYVLPKFAIINKLTYDDFHLYCELNLWNGLKETKLSYRVNEPQPLDIPLICGLPSNKYLGYTPNNNGVPIGKVNWILGETANCDIWISDKVRWCHKEKQMINGKPEITAIWIEDN